MILVNDCVILTMKGQIVMSSYMSIVPYRMEQEKFMNLNLEFEPPPIRLNY